MLSEILAELSQNNKKENFNMESPDISALNWLPDQPPLKKYESVQETQQYSTYPDEKIEEKITQFHSKRKRSKVIKYINQDLPADGIDLTSTSPCICSKTQCLKMYCACFNSKKFCGPHCACIDCHNVATLAQERNVLFEEKKREFQGCKCKKTKCQKRYCECLIRNRKCTSHCKCDGCHNKKTK